MAASPTGYQCEFIDSVLENFYCNHCSLVARRLTLTSCCGESYCHACIIERQQQANPCSCGQEGFTLYQPLKYQRQIGRLQVYCSMKERGCDWSGTLEQLDTHLDPDQDNCQHVDTKCPLNCQYTIPKNKVEQHVAEECVKRDYICQYCAFKATYEEVVDTHLPECIYVPLKCPNDCGVTCERDFIEDHMQICRLEEIACEFIDVGCDGRFKREDQEEHTKQTSQKHLTLTAAATIKMNQQLQQMLQEWEMKEQRLEEKILEQEKKIQLQEQKILEQDNEHHAEVQKLKQKLQKLDMKHHTEEQNLEQKIQQQDKKLQEQDKKLQEQDKKHYSEERKLDQKIQQQEKKLQEWDKKLQEQDKKLQERDKKHHTEERKLEQKIQQQEKKLQEQEKALKQLLQEQAKKLTQLQQNCNQNEVAVTEIKEIFALKRTFAVERFSIEKTKDVANDWKSPAMYTHWHGYKFCIGVDANGEGYSHGKAIVVDLWAMQGEYDHELKWPAEASFTIELVNQQGGENIKYTVENKSWNRPEKSCEWVLYFGPMPCVMDSTFLVHSAFLDHSKVKDFLYNDALHFNITDITLSTS